MKGLSLNVFSAKEKSHKSRASIRVNGQEERLPSKWRMKCAVPHNEG